MRAEIFVTVDRPDLPSGIVLIEDVASLAKGLNDSLLRLIQIDLGYPCGKRLRDETKKLASLGLIGVRNGSGVLQFSPLAIDGYEGRHPAIVATSEIVKGVQAYHNTGQWPAFLPNNVRSHLGAAVEPIADGSSSVKLSVIENGIPYECKIDNQLSKAMQELEIFSSDTPVELVGRIFDLNNDNKTFKIDTISKRVTVQAGDRWFKEADSDALRWRRIFIIGFPLDEKCNRINDIQELRAATDEDEDGISLQSDISQEESEPVFQQIKKKIDEFLTLEKDWDTYNSEAPSKPLLDYSLSFIKDAFRVLRQHGIPVPETFVVPTKFGGIQFEWEIENRVLELEIDSEKNFRYLAIEDDRETEGDAIRWQAIRLIRWVASGEKI